MPKRKQEGKASTTRKKTKEKSAPGGRSSRKKNPKHQRAKSKPKDGLVLQPQHQQLIDESGISPEVAEARGYRSIAVKAELERLGFSKNQRGVPALLMPVWDVRGEKTLYQARPDEPRIKDGKALKYETPHKARMSIDVPPTAHPWLGDPKRPLFITEGIRKADAAVSKDLCCVALMGVWNWRGTNDCGGTTALPDWESIALNGRQVFICFDSDVMTKPSVHLAMERLKAFLEKRGATVYLIYLPAGDGAAKVGLDDYLAGHSIDELLALAATELRELQTDNGQAGSGNGQKHRRPGSDQLLAEIPERFRQEAEQMLMDPELINRIVEDIETCGVVGEEELGLTVYLIGTSRLLDKPLGAIIQ